MSTKDYSWYVTQGKNLVKELKELEKKTEAYQVKICQYALEACTIRHGGKSNGIYTLKQYALDIGLPIKTVSNWVSVYRDVLMKVKDDRTAITLKEWSAAYRTHDLLRKERTNTNREAGKPRSRTAYKNKVPDEKVKRMFDETLANEKPFEREFLMLEASAKRIQYLLNSRDLGIISDSRLTHLMEILDTCSDKINDYLSAKRKKTA